MNLETELKALVLTALQDKGRSGAHQRLLEGNGVMGYVNRAVKLRRVKKHGPYFCLQNPGRLRIHQLLKMGIGGTSVQVLRRNADAQRP